MNNYELMRPLSRTEVTEANFLQLAMVEYPKAGRPPASLRAQSAIHAHNPSYGQSDKQEYNKHGL